MVILKLIRQKKNKLKRSVKILYNIASTLVPNIIKRKMPHLIREKIKDTFNMNSNYGEWISIQKINWKSKIIEWIPLCKHYSSNCRTDQDSHPHPVFNHVTDNTVYFTSNKNGYRGIYKIDIPDSIKD